MPSMSIAPREAKWPMVRFSCAGQAMFSQRHATNFRIAMHRPAADRTLGRHLEFFFFAGAFLFHNSDDGRDDLIRLSR